MPNILIYDPSSKPIANRVRRYLFSVPETDYERWAAGLPYLVQPSVPDGRAEKWKVDGASVVQLTTEELATIAAYNKRRALIQARTSELSDASPARKLSQRGMNREARVIRNQLPTAPQPKGYYLRDDGQFALPPGVIPAGVIVMWSGTLASVPTGWHLCDGTGGTPDLRERFVVGWEDAVNPGGVGGAASHDHAYDQVPNHTHPVNVNDPGHSHLTQRYPTSTGTSSGFTIDTSMSGTPTDNTLPVKSSATGITATSDNPAGGVATATTASSSNLPPFYRLAFIMKL